MSKKPIFNTVEVNTPDHSNFDLGYTNYLTCKFGELIPFYKQHTLPKSKYKINTQLNIQTEPFNSDIVGKIGVYSAFFAVPYRLLYQDWEDFYTGGRQNSLNPVFPKFDLRNITADNLSYFQKGSLYDYLGFPTFDKVPEYNGTAYSTSISLLPFKAYQEIYATYYADQQQLENSMYNAFMKPLASGNYTPSTIDVSNLFKLRKRCWTRDYFTSALPYPQNSPNAVTIPYRNPLSVQSASVVWNSPVYESPTISGPAAVGDRVIVNSDKPSGDLASSAMLVNIPVNSENVSTMQDLRKASALDRFLRKANLGFRYIEQLFSFFGQKSSDARLQRPQYIGGSVQYIDLSPVTSQTAPTESGMSDLEPLGTRKSVGFSLNNNTVSTTFESEEHCVILGIMSIQPEAFYFQGLDRMEQKFDRYDYFQPDFEHVGDQPIYSRELYLPQTYSEDPATDTDRNKIFGYTTRYAEYKFHNPQELHGEFRGELADTICTRTFKTQPSLNNSFLEVEGHDASDSTTVAASLDRVFALSEDIQNPFKCIIRNNVDAWLPMSLYDQI